MLPVPTTADLAQFTGRPASSFPPFAAEALDQATLMFSIKTHLKVYPDDPDLVKLAKNAIMEMADRLILEQPYTAIAAGPFQSETIGSYSYSRVTATTKLVASGTKTGLFWWDLAISELMIPDDNLTASGAIHHIPDGITETGDGQYELLSVTEQDETARLPYIRIS